MRKTIVSVFAAVSAFGLAGAAPASAAEGVNEVVVYSHEFSPLDVYENPQGCHALPLAAHQLNNRTDKVVSIYQDPLCLTSSQVQVPPGHGAHVMPGSGSFSLSE